MPKLSQSVLCVMVGALLGGACDGSDDTPPEQPDFQVYVTRLDDVVITQFRDAGGNGCVPQAADDEVCLPHELMDSVPLRCDGTLAVAVQIVPQNQFILRPAHACGESTRCGYVRLEALDKDLNPLASAVDTVTNEGVLHIPLDKLPELDTIHAVLMRGIDQKPVETKAGKPVEHVRRAPTLVPPANCEPQPAGGAGAGNGGAGGENAGPEPLGGAGGAEASPEPLGGAAGAENSVGGAGAGGAPPELGGAGAGS
jgi:hypothetical protein